MDTTEFLNAIWPETGLYCLAAPQAGTKIFQHYRADTVAKAAWLAQKLHAEKRDVYMAVGTLKAPHLTVLRDGKPKQVTRVQENIDRFKALFLDLDVGPHKAYTTQSGALKALVGFCRATNLAVPMIVNSGYGLHAYWCLTESIPADAWHRMASMLKGLALTHGLKADPVRTADMSSVLRVVGTGNYKDPAHERRVTVVKGPGSGDSPAALALLLAKALQSVVHLRTPDAHAESHSSHPLRYAAPTFTGASSLGNFDVASEPAELAPIVARCAQIRAIVTTRGNVPEPLWYHGLQLLRFTRHAKADGAAVAHHLSQGHPKYSPAETDAKLAQLAGTGPTTCDKFDSINPGTCTGCAFKGKLKSPLTIGRDYVPAASPTIQVDQGGGKVVEVALPPPPYPYLRTSTGKIAMEMADGEGNPMPPAVIYDYDLYPTRRLFDEVLQTEVFYFRSFLPLDGWREYPVPAFLIYDKKKLMEIMSKQGVMPDLSRTDLLVTYMLGYIQKLQRDMPADQIYAQLGWRSEDTEIVVGETSYRNDRTAVAIRVNDSYRNIVTNFAVRGDLDTWKKIINVYNQPGFEDFALALMTGFGALLFKHTGYAGAIFNLTGESGAGKSTVLKMIHSIYGKPTAQALLHQDTTKAKYAVLGVYNNLPITYDEITNVQPDELSDLCYAVSNGRGGNKLNQDSSFRQNTTSWQLPMFCSSNKSLVQILGAVKQDASGESMRVLERHIRNNHRYNLAEAQSIFTPLDDNYGHAGGVLASWMVTNQDTAKKLVKDYTKLLSERSKATSSERFWVALLACSLAGCTIGRALGLHEYGEQDLFAHCLRVIDESRLDTAETRKAPAEALVDFLNTNLSRTLVIREMPKSVPVVMLKPTQGLAVRNDVAHGRLYISKQAFREFCVKCSYDMAQAQRTLSEAGALLATGARKVLGDGTEFATGPTQCWVLDTKHAALSGVPPVSYTHLTLPTNREV